MDMSMFNMVVKPEFAPVRTFSGYTQNNGVKVIDKY